MSTTDWLVLVAGIGAIAWVNWYFLFAERAAAVAATTSGGQEIEILVRGGYEPGVVRVKRGVPTRLVFDRQETSSCSEEVVIPELGIRRFLPSFQKTPIEFTPRKAGTFDISCGMSMLHAKLVVEE
jgi:plastocyanin domain-containing protein